MKFRYLLPLSQVMAVVASIGMITLPATAAAGVLKNRTSSKASHASPAYLNEKRVPKLQAMTGGTLTVELVTIDLVVPRHEAPEAIGVGILDGDLTSIAYFSGIGPTFALMGRGSHACKAFVSKVPIRGVADFQDNKLRSPERLAAGVFKHVCAAPGSMSGSETYGALEKGAIDAEDHSAHANNDATGMHKVAKSSIFPGLHSTPILQFDAGQAAWEDLNPAEQAALESTYLVAYNGLRQHFDRPARQMVARDKAAGELGVIGWPQNERDAFPKIAQEVWSDFAAQSPPAKEAYETHIKFTKEAGFL